MSKTTSRGKMDRTAHAITRLVLNSGGPDRNPSDHFSYTDFKDCVSMGYDHTVLSKENGETCIFQNWRYNGSEFRKIIPYAVITEYSGQYDDKPRTVNLYSQDLECIDTITNYILSLCDSDNWTTTRQSVMTNIITGSVMNHVLNDSGHRVNCVTEPDNVRSKGVLYCIIFQSNSLVKVIGWDWCISIDDEFLIIGKRPLILCNDLELPRVLYYDDLMTMEITEQNFDDEGFDPSDD